MNIYVSNMTCFEKYSLWIGFGGVIVTFLAVVVAIWGERIRQHWTKPKLILSLSEPALTETNSRIKGWYFILSVKNTRRSMPATNVRILLSKQFKKGPDGTWQEKKFSGPTQVKWRWPIMPQYTTVGPEAQATFGYLHENSNNFVIQLYHIPNNLHPKIPKNDPTRIEFIAVSDSVESPAVVIEVSWDGVWTTGRSEMQEHLIVRQIFV